MKPKTLSALTSNRLRGSIRVRDWQTTAANRVEGLPLGPDHAGIFETTLLAALWPELVQLDRLALLQDAPLADGYVWEYGRHNSKHPIWGVVGPDPRHFKAEQAKPMLDATVAWLVNQIRQHLSSWQFES